MEKIKRGVLVSCVFFSETTEEPPGALIIMKVLVMGQVFAGMKYRFGANTDEIEKDLSNAAKDMVLFRDPLLLDKAKHIVFTRNGLRLVRLDITDVESGPTASLDIGEYKRRLKLERDSILKRYANTAFMMSGLTLLISACVKEDLIPKILLGCAVTGLGTAFCVSKFYSV